LAKDAAGQLGAAQQLVCLYGDGEGDMFRNLSMESLGISGRQSEAIELALSFGFQAIELDIEDFAEQAELYGLPHARRLIDSAHIRVGQFRLPMIWAEWQEDDVVYKQGLERLPKIAELAADLGCRHCVTAVRPACDERPYHENFEFHRRRLDEIGEILGAHDIRLGLEFQAPSHLRKGRAFQFIHSFEALVQLVKSVANEHVGAVVDLWHLHVGGGQIDEIRQLPAARIVAAYLSDVPPDADLEQLEEKSRALPKETGVVDSAACLRILAELGFDGPVTPKANRASLQGMRRDAIVKLARARMDDLWKEAETDVAATVESEAPSSSAS
jgi:sugar phosphate isomerase/epimerase